MCKNRILINCYSIQISFLLLILKWCLREAAGFNSPQAVPAWDSLIVKYPFNPSSPRCLKLISSWSLKKFSTHTLTQTGQNCCFLALCFFPVISCHFLSSNEVCRKNMFSLLALSTNSLQLKCVYTATRPGKSYRFHRNFISFQANKHTTHTQ